jgi:hypothetical protein
VLGIGNRRAKRLFHKPRCLPGGVLEEVKRLGYAQSLYFSRDLPALKCGKPCASVNGYDLHGLVILKIFLY